MRSQSATCCILQGHKKIYFSPSPFPHLPVFIVVPSIDVRFPDTSIRNSNICIPAMALRSRRSRDFRRSGKVFMTTKISQAEVEYYGSVQVSKITLKSCGFLIRKSLLPFINSNSCAITITMNFWTILLLNVYMPTNYGTAHSHDTKPLASLIHLIRLLLISMLICLVHLFFATVFCHSCLTLISVLWTFFIKNP